MKYLEILKKFDKAILSESEKLNEIYTNLLNEGCEANAKVDEKEGEEDSENEENPVHGESCLKEDETEASKKACTELTEGDGEETPKKTGKLTGAKEYYDGDDSSENGAKAEVGDVPVKDEKDATMSREDFFEETEADAEGTSETAGAEPEVDAEGGEESSEDAPAAEEQEIDEDGDNHGVMSAAELFGSPSAEDSSTVAEGCDSECSTAKDWVGSVADLVQEKEGEKKEDETTEPEAEKKSEDADEVKGDEPKKEEKEPEENPVEKTDKSEEEGEAKKDEGEKKEDAPEKINEEDDEDEDAKARKNLTESIMAIKSFVKANEKLFEKQW